MLVAMAPSLSALDPSRALTQYVHEVLNTDKGLPQSTVRAIVQTRDGYIWIGTEEGLARFDGVAFTTFTRRNVKAFRSNHVLALLEDRAGNLWIGTHGGGLMRYRNGQFTTFTAAEGLPRNFVYTLHEDRKGILWVGLRGGVVQFIDDHFVRVDTRGLDTATIWTIHQDRTSATWVGSDLNGMNRFADGKVTLHDMANGFPSSSITVIRQLRDGRVVIGTNGAGIHEWSDGTFQPIHAKGTLPSPSITALFEDSAGSLWIGTGAGLACLRGETIVTQAPGNLAQEKINAISEDREGTLWIGTSGNGLHRLRNGKVLTVTTANGLPSDRVRTIAHDRAGGVWIGTREGVAHVKDGTLVKTYTTRDGLPFDSVRSIFESSDGAIWLGTDFGGVAHLSGGRILSTVLDPDVPDNAVRAFAELRSGVWVGANGGRPTRFAGSAFDRKTQVDSPQRLFVRALVAARDGSLWIATDGNGLVHLVDGLIQRTYGERDGLSSESLRSLYLDPEGTLWIGTAGGGLNRLKNGRITAYTTSSGLFDDVVLQILEGSDGRLWMSSNNGIFAVEKRALDAYAEKKISRFDSFFLDEHDGMKSRDCNGGSQPAGSVGRDGRLWFPTDAGVVIVDPAHIELNEHVPPVRIERVIADRIAVKPGPGFEIPRGAKNIEISYTALSFVVPGRVRFKYKLEGYDEDWIDAGARRTAYYTGLHPGRYRFRVIASNDDGVWNHKGAAIDVLQQAFFHETPLFTLLVTAAILGLIWGAAALRIRALRRRKQRVDEAERQLIRAQRMEALGLMASGIAHDFNNTLMSALPWSDILRRKYPQDPIIQQAATNIAASVKRAKNVTRQLLDFAQPKPPATQPLDLAQFVVEEASMMRAVIPPNIQIETKTSPSPSVTVGDRAQLAQVLMNLLLNARDAMPHGGRILLEVRPPKTEEAHGWNIDPAAFILCSVMDTGTGIDQSVIDRIFDPFFTTKDIDKGTGLGLSVAARIVFDHRGKIFVDSIAGRGTTFHLLLPRASDEMPLTKGQIEAVASAEPGLVMIVDDESVVAEGIGLLLESEGLSVVTVATGAEALRRLDDGLAPDLIVLDLGLPGMSGDKVWAEIRRRQPNVPIVISSGYGDQERIAPLLRDPRTSYLRKPYGVDELLGHVTKHRSSS
jgi:ligand-binding sensor domain-containing protein/signal transduction histidine kinase/CheY-like chemotaxis protein